MVNSPEKQNTPLQRQDLLPHDLVDRACALAAELLTSARASRQSEEKQEAEKMSRLLADENGKELTFHLADEVFRPPTAKLQAQVFRRLVKTYGAPAYLPLHQRFLMHLGAFASSFFPSIVMPAVTRQIRHDSRRVILARETYLGSRERVNINVLGEAILGEAEAEKRLQENLQLLASSDCNYLSVKISAIFSQINLLDEEGTIAQVQERLRLLYRSGKFINLDMEEYRDLHLTYQAFRRTLDEPEFADTEAGIVLQAYLPDSYPVLQELTEWAKTRSADIKVRIVKGANLAMEKVEASIHGWAQAPYTEKVDVDANYKRMLQFACQPENAAAVRIGVASHNLFDIAYALLLRAHHQVEDRVELEMLEGMANDQARVLDPAHAPVLFYAPMVRKEDFHSAIAYLVRRLDENTSPENFLAHVFSMQPGDDAWLEQEGRFRDSCAHISEISSGPRRHQNRHEISPPSDTFLNSADTDWTLAPNRRWLVQHLDSFQASQPPALADAPAVRTAIQTALDSNWSQSTIQDRAQLLRQAAVELDTTRGRLIATMRQDACKRPFESDVEVSEAVDFANYYASRLFDTSFTDGTTSTPLGLIVVAPPWNFPCAIPCGGVLAALAAGNTVIIKPAPETILTAWEMVQCLWKAGIPRDALQFLPCPDNEVGQSLISAPEVGGVILTGGSETSDLFQSWRPDLALFAETSGKNALIVTAAADPDLAIKDLVHSAFGHAGQKCSAASLGLIQAELYDSPLFLAQLRDAAASLVVGTADDPAAYVTPLILDPTPNLLRGLTQLDEGESWLLEPKQISDTLWSPGIRLGVKAGSWIHRTELFGPVLALIRVDNLDHAIEIQNSSDFGLTGGLHSLDPNEIAQWRETVQVGNAYINRPITGAIVQRQPFGGWKRSCVGPGAKAGGPNYLTQFSHWTESSLPTAQAEPSERVNALLHELKAGTRLTAAARSYAYHWQHEFSLEHDPSQLHGETNHFRYLPAPEIVVGELNDEDLALIKIAAATVGTKLAQQSSHPLAKTISHRPLANGRLELLQYLHEQSVSETTHRHGRVKSSD